MVAIVFSGKNREVLDKLHDIMSKCSESGERITVDEFIRQNANLPAYTVAVNEWIGNGKGKISPRLKHLIFHGSMDELSIWANRNNYQIVGIDGPY